MSTATIQSTPPAVSSPSYVAREETRFGNAVKWFRYDSDINANQPTVVKVIKAVVGILLMIPLLFLGVGFFILNEVYQQRNEEKNVKLQAALTRTEVIIQKQDDPLSKEFLEQADYAFKDDTLAKMFGKTVEEIAAKRPTKEEIDAELKKQPQYLKMLPKIVVRDAATADEASKAFTATERERALQQALNANESKVTQLQEFYSLQVGKLDEIETRLKKAQDAHAAAVENANNANFVNRLIYGAPKKDPALLELEETAKSMANHVKELSTRLAQIEANPGDLELRIRTTEELLKKKEEALAQEQQKAIEGAKAIEANKGLKKTNEALQNELKAIGTKIGQGQQKIADLTELLNQACEKLNEAEKDQNELSFLRTQMQRGVDLAKEVEKQKKEIDALNKAIAAREEVIKEQYARLDLFEPPKQPTNTKKKITRTTQ